jgi:hypothetical protein
MRHLNILAAVAATMLVGGTAAAENKAETPKEKKICKVVEPAVGRIPAKRICMTKAEWSGQAAKPQHKLDGASEASGHQH